MYNQSDEVTARVTKIIRHFEQLSSARSNFNTQWEEVASLIRPNSRSTFQYGSTKTPGQKNNLQQVDASAMLALGRFGSIVDSYITPQSQMWHLLTTEAEYLLKDRGVRLWFEHTTKTLFRFRRAPLANFVGQNQQNWQEVGAFGNAGMFIDELDDIRGSVGLRYKALPLGETYIIENHQGVIVGCIRIFQYTPEQIVEKWPDTTPEQIRNLAERKSQDKLDILHYVVPNEGYDPQRLAPKYKLYKSCYVSMVGKAMLSEGGYDSFPFAFARYNQNPGESYGRGPAMDVLPALKTLNAEKTMFLKTGHRAADPVLLLADDGLLGMNVRPGAMNVGGWSPEGRPLVGTLPSGDLQITKEMMDEEKATINDAFLVTLFQILVETPSMTATEVIERTNEKALLMAPVLGKLQSEYLGALIDRELDVLSRLGVLPPMPKLLQEARGEYTVKYTSPLTRMMEANEASGAMRAIETARDLVNVTQDPSPLDVFNFDVIMPQVARINGVPESWMASEDEIAEKRAARQQQQQAAMEIQAAPAGAAMLKAQKLPDKSGA